MTAINLVVFVLLGFLCLPAYTEAADVVAAAVWDENVIEVSETYGTIELVNFTLFFVAQVISERQIFYALDITFLKIGLDPHFVLFFEFLLIFSPDFI